MDLYGKIEYLDVTYGRGNAIESRAKLTKQTGGSYALTRLGFRTASSDYVIMAQQNNEADYYGIADINSGAQSKIDTGYAADSANYHHYTIKYAATYKVDIDFVNKVSSATQVPTASMPLIVAVQQNSLAFYVDWVAIRNYTANEPTWGAWGSEEETYYLPSQVIMIE